MGFDIYIGNMTMELIGTEDDEEEYGEPFETPYVRVLKGKKHSYKPSVDSMKHQDAPTFPNDDTTGNGNSRHPGYGSWHDFCEITGLSHLFFDKQEGLMRQHPGFQPLNAYHVQAIDTALKRWKYEHPDAVPGFEEFSWGKETIKVGYDYTFARLIWLDWWVKWTFANCEHAGIYNF